MKAVFIFVLAALVAVPLALAQSDTQAPHLVALGYSSSTVDVTLAPQTIVFTLHVVDNLSGIDFNSSNKLLVLLRSPSGTQVASAAVASQPGIVLDAIIEIPVIIARYAEPGSWTVDSIRLRDNVGNVIFMNTAALEAERFPTVINVIDATPDTQPPELVAIAMSPSSIDVSASSANVTIDFTLKDDVSGVMTGLTSLSDFQIRSPSGNQYRYISNAQWKPVSGTSTDGVWRTTLEMPRYSEPGTWKVVSFRVWDSAKAYRIYSAQELSMFGPAIELTVASLPFDSTPPQLRGLSLTPAVINTSVGSQTVQVDMSITDNLAGVSFGRDTPYVSSAARGITFRSPSGAQTVRTDSFSNPDPVPVSGTTLNGEWIFNALFPQFSEEGTWTATASLKDATRNVRTYSTAQLAALGLPTQVIVIRPSLQPDGTIGTGGGHVADNAFGISAQIFAPPGVFSEPTSIAIDVLSSSVTFPLPVGFSSAETYFVNVELTPVPSFPLPFPGIVLVLPLRNYVIPGTEINLFRVDPATSNLVPALNVAGEPIVGWADPGGRSATFMSVARFSTVVGALPTVIAVTVDIKPGETPNTINTRSKGTIPVAVFSTPTLDVSQIDPSTLDFSGARVATNRQGKWQVAYGDLNDDGRDDLIAHFETAQILLGPSDTLGVIEGRTRDNRLFRGSDSVRVIK